MILSLSLTPPLPPPALVSDLKSPVVNMHFLNEWGDKQVVPYKPSMGHLLQGQRKARTPITPSQKPQNYAIIIDEAKIRVSIIVVVSKTINRTTGEFCICRLFGGSNEFAVIQTLRPCVSYTVTIYVPPSRQ